VTEAAEAAAAVFDLPGEVDAVEAHPTGHINEGYLVRAGSRRYLLQRLNPSVFHDAEAVMANVVAVTTHLRAKGEPTLTPVATRDGASSWRGTDGAVWRMYDYIEDAQPLAVRSPTEAALVGRAYGRFHRLLSDLDISSLRITLPGFHDPARRLAALEAAVADDVCGRAAGVAEEVVAVAAFRHLVDRADALMLAPRRVAHNDAKAANLLVHGTRPPVVVDLDTVMPGTVLWDFGDMVRSATGTSGEDADGVGPTFDADRYRALLGAYVHEVDGLLTEAERSALPVAGPVVTYEQAIRFLTDHVMGDVYFRVAKPGHNLDRARNQLTLLRSMLAALGQDVGS
jgi:Ser/Thr protein kinase RdoA (MazF antagonist)